MSLLTEPLPDSIAVSGREYKIRTDYVSWIRFAEILENKKTDMYEKILLAIKTIFDVEECRCLPPSIPELIEGLNIFFRCGKGDGTVGNASGAKTECVFSYNEDAEYIYAAFMEQYGIDLCKEKHMHWWTFCALMNGLRDDVRLMKIIAYRSVDLATVSDTARRKFYSKMKKLYALPDRRSQAERDSEISYKLAELF